MCVYRYYLFLKEINVKWQFDHISVVGFWGIFIFKLWLIYILPQIFELFNLFLIHTKEWDDDEIWLKDFECACSYLINTYFPPKDLEIKLSIPINEIWPTEQK